MKPLHLLQEVVCIDDAPGEKSQQKSLQKGKKYKVLWIHKGGVIVNDGTLGYWKMDRFAPVTPKIKTFGEDIADKIITQIKIEELLTKRLSAQ